MSVTPMWFRPPYIIAEMAQSYEGSLDVAQATLEAGARAGADAVKFQVFLAEELGVPSYRYYALYQKLELSPRQWGTLVKRAHALGVAFLADVFGSYGARMVNDLGADGFKIHSADTKNDAFIREVARYGRPMYLSAGGSTLEEVEHAIAIVRAAGNERVCLLDGIQVSPTPLEDTQLNRLRRLRRRFGVPVGCQDHIDAEHPLAIYLPLMALGAGAEVIEKHVTLDRAQKREDFESALNPDEFARMVALVREAAVTLGSDSCWLTEADLRYRRIMKKHVVAAADLPAGRVVTADDICFRRADTDAPLLGADEVVGRRLGRPVVRNDVLRGSDFVTDAPPRPRVVAVLLCRVQSSRLYAKPLQQIGGKTILEHLVDQLRAVSRIDQVILAIAAGEENCVFAEVAAALGVDYVVGDEVDGLARMIAAAEKANADVVVRFTTECPFIYTEILEDMIETHIRERADLSVYERLPEGAYGEVISLDALKRSHAEGGECHRSAWVSLFIFEHPERFRILHRLPPEPLQRPDIRITVDYPEDLVVCRAIYNALGAAGRGPHIADIIEFLDSHPEIKALNGGIEPGAGRIWT